MSNIFDYIAWRGDISFGNAPLCPIDALIFSMLAYIRFDGIVGDSPTGDPVRLSDAAAAVFADETKKTPAQHEKLLKALAKSRRFGGLRLICANRIVSREDGIQFAAVSVLLPGQNLFVAFEGTDSTLVGWHEDFRMSYECPVPAQLRAVEYLRRVAEAQPLRRLYIGGHSKGGNLAMYAAVYSGPAFRYRIRAVFNNDGPGFCDDTLASPEYLELRDRIVTYLPQSSIVGVLLEHDDNYKIVQSSGKGIAQHDAYSWQCAGADFLYATERTAFGLKTEAILDHFINKFSPARKRLFSEALFSLLERTNAETLDDLGGSKLQSVKNLYRAYADAPPEVRELLVEVVSSLNQSRKAIGKKELRRLALPETEASS